MALQVTLSGFIAALRRSWQGAGRGGGEASKAASLPGSGETLVLGGAVADLATGLVRRPDGSEAVLRPQSAQVLRELAARRGHNVSKDELFDAVWADVAVTDDSLVQCIGDIRRAIGDAAHRVVQTVPRRGYRLVPEAGPLGPAPTGGRRRRVWIALVPVLLAVIGLAGWSLRPSRPAEPPSIAVLPLENLSDDPRWARIGKGIAAEISTDLGRSRGIIVTPPETVQASGPGETLAVARGLGVRFVLDGTMQVRGDAMRVTARLMDVASGRVLWSDRWNRPSRDIFVVQDEIVAAIGGRLDGTWTGVMAQALRDEARRQPDRSLDAFELYLLGAEAKHRFTPEGYDAAMRYLRRALVIDPDFVEALVALSIVATFKADITPDAAASDALFAEAARLAEKAVALDPDDPNALVRLSSVRVLEGRRSEAWRLVSRAVEIAPNNPDVLATAAWCYPFDDHAGRPLDWAERAIALNPGHPDWYEVSLGLAALFAGEPKLARRAAMAGPVQSDTLLTRAAAEALLGNITAARSWFARFAAETRHRSLSSYYMVEDMSLDPVWEHWVRAARLAGFPVTDAEAGAPPQISSAAE